MRDAGAPRTPHRLGRSWDFHALRTAPLHLFDANIFHPLTGTLAFSEDMLGAELLMLPADVLFGDPVLDRDVLVFASFYGAGP